MTLRDLMLLGTQQHGVVSLEQALASGVSRSTLQRLAAREGWRRLQRGVYLLPGADRGLRQECQGALLAAGEHAVLCRRTAAHLYGLLPPPAVVELFLPLAERAPGLTGVRVCRTRTLNTADLAFMDGLRATTPTRTVIDLAAVLEPPELRAVLISARQRRLVDLDRLGRRSEQIGPVRGIGVVRRLLRELHPEWCDSILEERVRDLVRQAGLPPPHPKPFPVETPGRRLHVDIAWPSRRVGIEVDGFAYHSSHAAMERDHRRANALLLAGWRILHVGWQRVESDADTFVAELRAAIR